MSAETEQLIHLASLILEVVLIASGVLGFIFRAWIAEWIKARFSKAVAQELESHKHKLNIELEAYKSTLIHDLEHLKAAIDIKRTIAIKMAEARLESLRALHTAMDNLGSKATIYPAYTPEMRKMEHQNVMSIFKVASDAYTPASIFLPGELRLAIATAKADASALISAYPATSVVVLQRDDPAILSLMQRFAEVSIDLQKQIFEGIPDLK